MSTSLVAGYLPAITSEQLGTAMAATAWITSERTSVTTTIGLGQHHADDSLVSAWVLIGTMLSCLAVMMAVVFVTATSMS